MIDLVVSDITSSLRLAASSDPVEVLLPVAVVALREGLSAGGVGKIPGGATRGLGLLGLVIFVWSGVLDLIRGGFAVDSFMANSWNSLMGLGFKQLMGFWLLLAAVMLLVVLVRGFARR